ncbi:MAG: transposase [Desulfococcaceae bacterium]
MKPPKTYPSDITYSQYKLISRFLPQAKSGPGKKGRPACDLRTVINTILYVNKAGCQRRMLPVNFCHWNTVYGYFSRWPKDRT